MAIEGRKETTGSRIRYGMVGGGQAAFIGGVHRIAARIDDQFELVAGALSSSPEKALASFHIRPGFRLELAACARVSSGFTETFCRSNKPSICPAGFQASMLCLQIMSSRGSKDELAAIALNSSKLTGPRRSPSQV